MLRIFELLWIILKGGRNIYNMQCAIMNFKLCKLRFYCQSQISVRGENHWRSFKSGTVKNYACFFLIFIIRNIKWECTLLFFQIQRIFFSQIFSLFTVAQVNKTWFVRMRELCIALHVSDISGPACFWHWSCPESAWHLLGDCSLLHLSSSNP